MFSEMGFTFENMSKSTDEIVPPLFPHTWLNRQKLANPIEKGEILTDLTKKQWRLGQSIATGGFGRIFLASDDITKPVRAGAPYVIKVEPHTNGPLFVEINFLLRAAKSESIEAWMKAKKLKFLGLPRFISSGSHEYGGEKYRFLVEERFGEDLQKVFERNGKNLSLKTVLNVGIKILNVLQYIHSKEFIHGDIKASNLLLGYKKGVESDVYLVDFGLACRYSLSGFHKKYQFDLRKAHDGTIEYTSRDAHTGAHSRRGDLEILGYNLLQWLCGKLPWEDNLSDPEYVHMQKVGFMSNVPMFMKRCFPDENGPAAIGRYLQYVADLAFETEPNYEYCRQLLRKGLRECGLPEDGKVDCWDVASLSPKKGKKGKKRCRKRCIIEEPENINKLMPSKIEKTEIGPPREPCRPKNINRMSRSSPNNLASPVLRSNEDFRTWGEVAWEVVLASDPERPFRRKSCSQKDGNVDCPDIKKEETLQCLDISKNNPTPAMLEVMQRMREKTGSPLLPGGRQRRKSSGYVINDDELPSYYTPAMELVIKRRAERLRSERIGASWLPQAGSDIYSEKDSLSEIESPGLSSRVDSPSTIGSSFSLSGSSSCGSSVSGESSTSNFSTMRFRSQRIRRRKKGKVIRRKRLRAVYRRRRAEQREQKIQRRTIVTRQTFPLHLRSGSVCSRELF